MRSTKLFPILLFSCFLGCSEQAREAPPASPPGTAEPVAPEVSAATTATPVVSASASASPEPSSSSSAAIAAPPPKPAPIAGKQIWGLSRFAWIHPTPVNNAAWIGYLSLGSGVSLKGGSLESARAIGPGCKDWYAIEPDGFLCAGQEASIDPANPQTAALIRETARADSPWPFDYGESLGAPRYNHVPTADEQRTAEWDLELHLGKVAAARAATTPEEIVKIDKEWVGVDFSFAGTTEQNVNEVSPFVREARNRVVKGSTVAWVRAFDVEYPDGKYGLTKRTFLLTADYAFVPKDRVKPYPKSQFQGVKLGGDAKLPLAFFRKTPKPKYKQGPDGAMAQTGEQWPAKGHAFLTGEQVKTAQGVFLATREPGIFAKLEDAHVVELQKPPSRFIGEAKGRGTWLDVSVLGGWLVAYEKETPVYATLISPGRGGIPYPGIDALKTASTPTGQFRVDGKFVAATMVSSSNADIVHTEVQYVQNFHGPHALHGAYWHDVFGEPKSGGCINLSPIDSKWVFEFTEPALPPGWHGIRSVDAFGYATIVYVHR